MKNIIGKIIKDQISVKMAGVLKRTLQITWLMILLIAIFDVSKEFVVVTYCIIFAHILVNPFFAMRLLKSILNSGLILPEKEKKFKKLFYFGTSFSILNDCFMLFLIVLITNHHTGLAVTCYIIAFVVMIVMAIKKGEWLKETFINLIDKEKFHEHLSHTIGYPIWVTYKTAVYYTSSLFVKKLFT